MKNDIVWYPGEYFLNGSRIARFAKKHGIDPRDWRALVDRTKDTEWFYPAIFEDLEVEWFEPFHTLRDTSEGMPFTKWFLGGKINIAYNCIDRHIKNGKGKSVALQYETESSVHREISYDALFHLVNLIASAMKQAGIQRGDVVGMCMSLSPESIALMFACFKIGAICMQMASSFSLKEVMSHVSATKAKIFFMADGYIRAGKRYDLEQFLPALQTLPDLQTIVLLEQGMRLGVRSCSSEKKVLWEKFIVSGIEKEAPTEWCGAEDIALMLFSSGTTGVPKMILHTHGGLLAQIPKEVGYVFDCKEGDIFCWLTDFGWMMAPWELVGVLFFGATVAAYNGSIFYPNKDRIFEMVDAHRISILGVTPDHIFELMKAEREGFIDVSKHDLSSLRMFGSTARPLPREWWIWLFEKVGKSRLPIMNIWGGTDLCSCLGYPLPIMPLKPATVGAEGLGMHTDVWDEYGKPVRNKPGHVVCTDPFPSQTRGFWEDEDSKDFIKAYFTKFGKDVWAHGDYAEIDEDGYWFHLGRADDIINRRGVKFDPERFSTCLLEWKGVPAILDAAVIGIPDEELGDRIAAFVVVDFAKAEIDISELRKKLSAYVKSNYRADATIDDVYSISGIPRKNIFKTPFGLIRKIFCGEDIEDTSGLLNRQAIEEIRNLGELHFKK